MNYAIIAAGEGSRLAQEGFSLPKPMVTLHGRTLINRLIGIFRQNSAGSISIIINENSPLLEEHLSSESDSLIKIVKQSTPSSLHSFGVLLNSFGSDAPICLTTTDTVFKEEEFKSFVQEFESHPGLDGLFAVTSFIDDESPLFVHTDAEGYITSFADKNNGDAKFVSGGIYCLREKALGTVADAINKGTSRMRNFQRQLLDNGFKIKAYQFSKIVDVDHVKDIRTAEDFLTEEFLELNEVK